MPPEHTGTAPPPSQVPEFPVEVSRAHLANLADAKRLRALSASKLVNTLPEEAYDRLTRLATKLLGAPVSLMSLVDTEQQFFKSTHGLPETLSETRSTPLSQSLCQYIVSENRGLAVHDTRSHPLLKDSDAVTDLGVIAYLGEPIHSPDGQVLGSFCAIDDKPHLWTPADQATLRDLADMIEGELKLRHAAHRNDLLLKEMNHRVKNLFTLTGSLVRQSSRLASDKAELTERLLGRLMALSSSHELALGDASAMANDVIKLGDLVDVALAPYMNAGSSDVATDGPALVLTPSAITYIALVLHELATNAAKYGALSDNGGSLSISWDRTETGAQIAWTEKTAIADPKKSKGFGSAMLDDTVIYGLNGEIDRDISETGIRYVIDLPSDTLF